MKISRWFRDMLDRWSATYISGVNKLPTKRRGMIRAYGEECHMIMPLNEAGTVDWALDEVAAMTIRCAWCGKAIFISDPITLYSPTSPADLCTLLAPKEPFTVPDYAVIYSQNPLCLVGCGRTNCADSLMDYCGTWMPDPSNNGQGAVRREASMMETILANPTASAFIGDLESDGSVNVRVLP